MFPKRLDILRFLAREAGDGRSPTIPEIARAVGLRSTQTVHHHLKTLEREGYLSRAVGKARSVGLTEQGWEAAGKVPTLGRIAAGPGMEAVRVEEVSTVARELFGAGRFLLEARGQSMTGAGIEDGDQLLVVADPSPPDGTIVAALIGGEMVTVKRLFRERGPKGESVRLRAENGEHKDIVAPAGDVEVQGRVELILRRPWKANPPVQEPHPLGPPRTHPGGGLMPPCRVAPRPPGTPGCAPLAAECEAKAGGTVRRRLRRLRRPWPSSWRPRPAMLCSAASYR